MSTVANTSAVMNLAIIGHLALLREQFGEVLVPRAVVEELRLAEDLPGNEEVREAIRAGWLQPRDAKQQALVRSLGRELDLGEAEAIALAIELNAEKVLLDERDARRVAKSQGLRVTGVVGILRRAWREKRIPSLREAIGRLRDEAGFHLDEQLIEEVLRDAD
ncbi:MAG TPA: DUF3368 domain-containing protein [Planctomycetota bacterium]|nr:DUF3368 domain-containing protein [Planctomycetota bacterium]